MAMEPLEKFCDFAFYRVIRDAHQASVDGTKNSESVWKLTVPEKVSSWFRSFSVTIFLNHCK